MRRILFLFVTLVIMMMTSTVLAQGKKILYVPIDDRPCNLYQVVQVAEKLGYELLTPPTELLGRNTHTGDPDKLWAWLEETAPQADFAAISTDAMLYGSLVDSRIQNLDPQEIMARAKRFQSFDEKFPYLTIYAFGTVMRTPRSGSNASAEPEYYHTYGAKIFQYTALLDKKEMGKTNGGDERTLKKLAADIPKEYLDDWFARRAKNFDANKYLIDLTREGVFDYFLLGCDDSAIFSQTHKESRYLTDHAKDLGKTVVQVTSGADELGMLMISRAINKDRDQIPFVSVMYNDGKGAATFPTYCNEPIGISIDAAIIAAGGLRIPAPERADLILAVNTRGNGKTFEAPDVKKNKLRLRGDLKTFLKPVKSFLEAGYPVAIADIAFANGADNALMNQLKKDDLQYRIRAYGGWNTATNSSGFLIGASVLTKFMDERDIAELLTTRYLDEWAYQANVRQEITAECYRLGVDPYKIGNLTPKMNDLTTEKIRAFAAANLILPQGLRLEDLKVSLPWHRVFECDPRFKLAD
ncbi:MAG: DUF4127 family protein [Selenomonadaceae bacterium]|nr:DUF4127 family protein [Selenomonadaceae bacterium]